MGELKKTEKPLDIVLFMVNAGCSPAPGIALALAEETSLQGVLNTSLIFFLAGEAMEDSLS